MILKAVGHDDVLELFLHNNQPWVVTEGGVALFDHAASVWVKVYDPGFRFYWNATAAFDDGNHLYVGSDRGTVSRMDLRTGAFEMLALLKDRSITEIRKPECGGVLVLSRPAPLGALPTVLVVSNTLGCSEAVFDGQGWRAAQPSDLARNERKLSPPEPSWFFKEVKKRHNRDKSHGNFLWGTKPGRNKPEPRFYLKGVFYPRFLCASEDDARLWVSTFTGIARVDTGAAPP